ncbi:oxidation resistance protein 1a isoform X3 [Boleophthalmus pectinirostris]|uniref:oxidation resistance protein 1a isoform X3 n=1 Tax=Boleophthalmus pectinirostris TaxID=150288 RepID=UPI00243318C8|nr:oxidation resistance protein 1a isoform X3 [Boleophthalmus pectinirostris]
MDYLFSISDSSAKAVRALSQRLWPAGGPILETLPPQSHHSGTEHRLSPDLQKRDTGQKKTPEKKDGRRMSFQRPKGTVEYSVESRDTLNSIALKFDTTPNELVQLNKLFSRAVVPGQVLYVPDPEYVSSVGSSPSLSPISPLSPTSSEADLDKVTRHALALADRAPPHSPGPSVSRLLVLCGSVTAGCLCGAGDCINCNRGRNKFLEYCCIQL